MTRLMTMTACLCFAMALTAFAEDQKKAAPKGEDWSDKDLTKENFENKAFKDYSTFADSDLKEVNFSKAIAKSAVFTGADLTRTNMHTSDLSGSDFRKAKVEGVKWAYANLSGANLEGLDLTGNYMYQTNLRGANLRNLKGIGHVVFGSWAGTDLRGANLSQMTTGGEGFKMSFAKARYDAATRWPAGLDPAAAGAVLVTEDKPK
jgi:uncharacterized protein YjbI with pentapeptide repeats